MKISQNLINPLKQATLVKIIYILLSLPIYLKSVGLLKIGKIIYENLLVTNFYWLFYLVWLRQTKWGSVPSYCEMGASLWGNRDIGIKIGEDWKNEMKTAGIGKEHLKN